MDKMTKLSKLMSYWLRHRPDDINIKLDKDGWVDLDTFVAKAEISRETIEQIVTECPKQRFTIKDGRIRANQGHSVKVDMTFKEVTPPSTLFHGTSEQFLTQILMQGLRPMNRHHVHLSKDAETAFEVANRRRNPKILTVNTVQMRSDGVRFYLSDNGVYLVDYVNPKYIKEYL